MILRMLIIVVLLPCVEGNDNVLKKLKVQIAARQKSSGFLLEAPVENGRSLCSWCAGYDEYGCDPQMSNKWCSCGDKWHGGSACTCDDCEGMIDDCSAHTNFCADGWCEGGGTYLVADIKSSAPPTCEACPVGSYCAGPKGYGNPAVPLPCNSGRFCGGGESSAEGRAALSTISLPIDGYKVDFAKSRDTGSRCAITDEDSLEEGYKHVVGTLGIEGLTSLEECTYVCQSLTRHQDQFGQPTMGMECTGFNFNLEYQECFFVWGTSFDISDREEGKGECEFVQADSLFSTVWFYSMGNLADTVAPTPYPTIATPAPTSPYPTIATPAPTSPYNLIREGYKFTPNDDTCFIGNGYVCQDVVGTFEGMRLGFPDMCTFRGCEGSFPTCYDSDWSQIGGPAEVTHAFCDHICDEDPACVGYNYNPMQNTNGGCYLMQGDECLSAMTESWNDVRGYYKGVTTTAVPTTTSTSSPTPAPSNNPSASPTSSPTTARTASPTPDDNCQAVTAAGMRTCRHTRQQGRKTSPKCIYRFKQSAKGSVWPMAPICMNTETFCAGMDSKKSCKRARGASRCRWSHKESECRARKKS